MTHQQFDEIMSAILENKKNPQPMPKLTLETIQQAYENNKQIEEKWKLSSET